MRSMLLTALCAGAVASSALAEDAGPAMEPVAGRHFGAWGVDLSARNLAVKPGDGFFEYAQGLWYRDARIPEDQPSVGVDYDLYNLGQARLRALIEESVRAPIDATDRKVGDFYKAYMDDGRVEALGEAPLRPALERVRKVQDKSAMARLMGATSGGFGYSFFAAGVWPDDKAPTRNALALGQGGFVLPDRDDYLTAAYAPQRAAYRDYVERTLAMIGWPEPAGSADAILAMETRVAAASWSAAEMRETTRTYNPMSVAELEAFAPGFDWRAYLRGAKVAGVRRVIVRQKSAFPKIAAIYASTPLSVLKAWEAFSLADQSGPFLSKRFVDSNFQFHGKAMSGVETIEPRWKRAVENLSASMTFAVGHAYVERFFPASSKAAMEALVVQLKTAMAGRIARASWMSAATRDQALDKLRSLRVMVGYPKKWRDYSKLQIAPDDLYGDAERDIAFAWDLSRAKLAKLVDPEEWQMAPQEVNAYNDASRNLIVFPAGILQPPYFDPDADAAANYGAIGALIGHEITHGFDDQGRHYDAAGALRDWWTQEDTARFDAETRKLGRQFAALEVAPGLNVNGELTMGENLADLGGLLVALDAYHASLGGRPAPVIDGLTGDQRLFLAYAQSTRQKIRPDAEKQQLASDPHTPLRFRAEQPERDIDAWYAAFDVTPGQKLYLAPADRTRIW